MAGEHLETGQVVFEWRWVVQEDVEAEEVYFAHVEEFCWGEGGKGAEGCGVLGAYDADQFVEEAGDAGGAVPADHFGGDFVGYGVGEYGGVSGAIPGGLADHCFCGFAEVLSFEEAQLAPPGDIDQES